jgi:hypothetical protein
MVHKSPASAKAERPVDARQATKSAFDYFYTLFSNTVPFLASDPSLEEIETSKDGRYWLVTLGYNAPRPKDPRLPEFLQVPMRKLKVFKVDAATGRVLSMKIPQDE